MKFILNKDKLTIEKGKEERPNSGSTEYYKGLVEYDESWNGLIIEAILTSKEGGTYADEGKFISIPPTNEVAYDNKTNGSFGIGFKGYTIEYSLTEDTVINPEKTYYTLENNVYTKVENPVVENIGTYYEAIKNYQISTNIEPIYYPKGAGQIETSEEDLPTPTQWEIYIAQIQAMLDNIETVPAGGTTGQVLAKKSNTDGDVEWQTVQSGGGAEEDNITITKNSQQKIQTVAIKDTNTGNPDKFWSGTQEEYEAITTKDPDTFYYITDDDTSLVSDIQINSNSIVSSGTANIITKTPYNASSNKIATESDLPDISGKQDIIDSSHKLSADLISDGSTNKTVTATEKSTWSGKSVVSGTNDGTNWSTITIDGTTKNIPAGGGGGGTATDVQINGTSIVSNNTANIITNTAYNSSSNKIATMTDVNSKQDKIPVETSAQTTISIDPNKYYSFGEVASLDITLATPSDNTIYNEYMFEFDSGTTPTTLTLPNTVSWVETPTIEASKTYQVSIVNNIALIVGV